MTKDDAMCFDFGMWIAERIAKDNQCWLASTAMRQHLDDNFALTPARSGVNTVKSMINVGMKRLQRVNQGVKVAALPEARRVFSKDRPKGVKLIMTHLLNLAQEMHQEGRTYREWTLVGRRSLEFFAKEQELETIGDDSSVGMDVEPGDHCQGVPAGPRSEQCIAWNPSKADSGRRSWRCSWPLDRRSLPQDLSECSNC